MDDRAIQHLKRWHELERFGAELCSMMCEESSDPVEKSKWKVLGQLEQETVDWLGDALERHGITPTPYSLSPKAREVARSTSGLPWRSIMETSKIEVEAYLSEARREERGTDPDFLRLARNLTVHEEAWLYFIEMELAEQPEISLDRVRQLLR